MEELNKGAWSPQEDRRLISYITKYGIRNWSQMPKFAGLARTGKSCRLRWINYLRPDVRRGPFSMEEVETIVRMYLSLGNRWSAIAAQLPGRTDNDIKNFYHTHLKKHLQAVNVPVTPPAENRKMTHKNKNKNAVKLLPGVPQGSTCNNQVEEKPPPVSVAEKPRHDQNVTTSAVVLDSNNPNAFGNPDFAHHQGVRHFSSSSARMDMMSLSLEDYNDLKSFWYNVLTEAEYLKF